MSEYDELRVFQQMIMCFDTPAYMRRARDTVAGWNAAVAMCRKQREAWFEIPRLRLAQLRCHLDGVFTKSTLFSRDDATALDLLFEDWQPVLKANIRPAGLARVIRRSADEMLTAFRRFNSRWEPFLTDFDLSYVNQCRQGYNDFYVLEKECAVLSPRVAKVGFVRLEPATIDDLRKLFPLLPIATLRKAVDG